MEWGEVVVGWRRVCLHFDGEVWQKSDKQCQQAGAVQWGKVLGLTFVARVPNGTRSSEDARGADVGRAIKCRDEEKTIMILVQTCQRMDMTAVPPLHQSNALCIMRATVTDAREPVCVRINAPGAVGAAQAHSPRGVCLDRATRLQHFPWNGAELWLALERAKAVKLPSKSAQQGQRLHV
jgi:hypothetical protein